MQMKTPKRLRGQSPAHRRAPLQEKRAAEMIGGRTTPGSGSGYQGGDARRRKLVRVECKCTTNKSFSVTRAMIEKLEGEVFGSGEIPVIQVELMVGVRGDGVTAYVVPSWAMEDLLERLTGAAP